MKKLIFFLLLLLSTASLFAQSEQPSDSIRHLLLPSSNTEIS